MRYQSKSKYNFTRLLKKIDNLYHTAAIHVKVKKTHSDRDIKREGETDILTKRQTERDERGKREEGQA